MPDPKFKNHGMEFPVKKLNGIQLLMRAPA